jgi:Cdc6-like AAA superfamily ATPase
MGEAIVNATNDARTERTRAKCLECVSNVHDSAQQSDDLGRRQANTGEWFFEDKTFENWISGSNQTWALFCPGAPGAGKTTMSATVIHHLSSLRSDKEIGVAYIYCDYLVRTDQTTYSLPMTLLRRLVQIRTVVPKDVIAAYSQFQDKRRLTLQECTELIISVCKEF